MADPADESNAPLWVLVRQFGGPYTARFGMASAGLLFAQVARAVPALVLGVALDAVILDTAMYALPLVPDAWIPGGTTGQLWLTVGVLGLAYSLDAVSSVGAGRLSGIARFRTMHDVRVAAFDALVGREMVSFDDSRTGDVMSVLNNDVENLDDFLRNALQGVRFLARLLAAFGFMMLLHPQLAALLAVVPLGLAVVTRWYANRVEPRYDAVRRSVGRVNSRLRDSIEGIETVKTFGRENQERDAVAAASREYRDENLSVVNLELAYELGSWVVASSAFVGVFAVGSYLALAGGPPAFGGSLTAGTLLTFLLYSKSFSEPVRRLMHDVVDSYKDALASSKRIVELLESDRDRVEGGRELTVTDGSIEFDGVSFTYPGGRDRTLADVSFEVAPGEHVGVVGPTGAGKSTVTKLLFRFYDPDDGRVRVDGVDLATVSGESLRDSLGVVSQEPLLFPGSVRENVAYGVEDATEDDVRAATTAASARGFVADLPDGFDTQVGERGTKLSGGQRQRIAIARAVLEDPEILVLDEAMSHVDVETERRIQCSLDAIATDRTTVTIAHRLSTVRDADRILVVDDGRIVECGTHEELLAGAGLYADLWHAQVGKFGAVSDGFFEGRTPGPDESDLDRLVDEPEVVR